MLLPDEVKENTQVFNVFVRYALWSFIFILLIFVFVWQSIKTADLEYRLNQASDSLSVLQKEKKDLETEISFLSSPERIGAIAEKELNLVPVNHDNIIWINCSKQRNRNMFTRK